MPHDPLAIGALAAIIVLLILILLQTTRSLQMSQALTDAVTRLQAVVEKLPADVAAAVTAGGDDSAAVSAINDAATTLETLDASVQPAPPPG
jgi:hypothetical protein